MVDTYFPNKKRKRNTNNICLWFFGIINPLPTYDSFRLIKIISQNSNKLFRNHEKPRFDILKRMDGSSSI